MAKWESNFVQLNTFQFPEKPFFLFVSFFRIAKSFSTIFSKLFDMVDNKPLLIYHYSQCSVLTQWYCHNYLASNRTKSQCIFQIWMEYYNCVHCSPYGYNGVFNLMQYIDMRVLTIQFG